ncbi:hypothetical protein R3P38DRAFT_2427601, partial [Favolaschia claudopus]
KTCNTCRESNRKAQAATRKRKADQKDAQEARKRAREHSPETERVKRVEDASNVDKDASPAHGPNLDTPPGMESDEEEAAFGGPVNFASLELLFQAIRGAFTGGKPVEFHGTCQIPEDPMVTDKERVKMTAHEIWKITGYRFKVKDNKMQVTGHKTRLWCCQDQARKLKSRPSQREGAKPRDTLGMDRYDCKSALRIACLSGDIAGEKKLRVYIKHDADHLPYYDVSLPPGAAAIIRENLEWHTPVEIAPKVRAQYPSVTA